MNSQSSFVFTCNIQNQFNCSVQFSSDGCISGEIDWISFQIWKLFLAEHISGQTESGDGALCQQIVWQRVQRQAVLLKPQRLQPWALGQRWGQTRNLILVQVQLSQLKAVDSIRYNWYLKEKFEHTLKFLSLYNWL